MKTIAYIVSIFLPPLGVFLVGRSFGTIVLNIVLTLLGYLPGLIHAFIEISKEK